MTIPSPATQADLILAEAQLRDLVDAAREHRAGPCQTPQCLGERVLDRIVNASTGDRLTLLLTAVAQLADQTRPANTHGAPGEPPEDTIVRVGDPADLDVAYFVRDDSVDFDETPGEDHWWSLQMAGSPLTWQQVCADGPPVALAPSTPDPEKGPTS